MIAKGELLAVLALLAGATTGNIIAQGTFQNLDFENGSFVPIPGQFNTVEFAPAVPGWTGYLGTNQIDWILYNSRFLSEPGMSIYGPDQLPGEFHGQYYVLLQNSFPPSAATVPSLAQTAMISADALSLRFVTGDALAVGFSVFCWPADFSLQLRSEWPAYVCVGRRHILVRRASRRTSIPRQRLSGLHPILHPANSRA